MLHWHRSFFDRGVTVLFLALFSSSFFASSAFACSVDSDCDGNGSCQNGACSCNTFYMGTTCNEKWIDAISGFAAAMRVYGAVDGMLHFFIFCFVVQQLYLTFKYAEEQKWKKYTVVTFILVLEGFGSLLRMIEFFIDPHAIFGILSETAESIIFDLPLIAWMSATFLLQLHWVSLRQVVSLSGNGSFTKLKPLLIAFAVMVAAVLIPVGIWLANDTLNLAAILVYNVFVLFVLILLVVMNAVIGIKLASFLKESMIHSSRATASSMPGFVKKMHRYIIMLSSTVGSLVVTIILFVGLNAGTQPWLYYGIYWFLRVEEVLVVSTVLVFLKKRRSEAKKRSSSLSGSDTKPRTRSSTNVEKSNSGSGSKKTEDEERDVETAREKEGEKAKEKKKEENAEDEEESVSDVPLKEIQA